MAKDRPVYMGPRLRRLRRELGLTQADMAADLDISASYVALLERNQRPLTADMLLRLARTYRLDMAEVAGDGGAEQTARLQAVLRDPMFADIDLPALATGDVAVNYPGITEALLRLYTSYREEHLALADRGADAAPAEDAADPVAESRRFLAARRNCFPLLDDLGERLAAEAEAEGGLSGWLRARHNLRVRHLPSDVMAGSMRRLDRHRDAVLLDETLDGASAQFQLALQIAYLEMRKGFDALLKEGQFSGASGQRLARRALASYGAAAILMPYSAFAKAVEAKAYDVEALGRQFGASFEQTAHRLTTLQKPGQERVPFFFLRVDPAGNVSKRLDGAGFPFARHGGSCPLWSVHRVFERPREVVTQWLELPDGQRFFSIARTVTAGGGGWGAAKVERAIALCCAAEHAHRLVYTRDAAPAEPTPIGVTCRLCHRANCMARSAPPIGREMLPDDYRRTRAPFGFEG
ncbi:XRE family transcriptional regulator [Sphingobium amiense]|uniref:XRE family transcriptional regulator n=1 Tax=Sphingobium amiense TaxID=135719 RepID=A0A494W325_9SPHN|nr:helix-turn-helix transcriptional regulator [Sphingobium amiense]BBD98611.1 XRE family transcriptional regulator [Sphingobium amiense]